MFEKLFTEENGFVPGAVIGIEDRMYEFKSAVGRQIDATIYTMSGEEVHVDDEMLLSIKVLTGPAAVWNVAPDWAESCISNESGVLWFPIAGSSFAGFLFYGDQIADKAKTRPWWSMRLPPALDEDESFVKEFTDKEGNPIGGAFDWFKVAHAIQLCMNERAILYPQAFEAFEEEFRLNEPFRKNILGFRTAQLTKAEVQDQMSYLVFAYHYATVKHIEDCLITSDRLIKQADGVVRVEQSTNGAALILAQGRYRYEPEGERRKEQKSKKTGD